MVYLISMNVALSIAKAQLTDLVRRAEAGEEIVLTRHGQPVAAIVARTPKRSARSLEQRREAIMRIMEEGGRLRERLGLSGRQMQDDIYDEDGLPA